MKNKNEKAIRDIAMLALPIVLILGKLGKVKIEIMIAYVGSIVLILLGGYSIYKGLKLGGAFFFSIASIGILVILSWYYNSDTLVVPIPSVFIIIIILSYKLVCTTDNNKETINHLKKMTIFCTTLCLIIQIVVMILFIKK